MKKGRQDRIAETLTILKYSGIAMNKVIEHK